MASPAKTSMYRFKDITTIPGAKDLVDIVLSQTQRRTPTVVHPQFKISRIRSFYMRKIKFCQQTFHDKFTQILTEFPRLDDIHPFYADLCNVLYDRNHYKLGLGQVNTVRGIVDHIAKDYVRLLKYADSPYKCKMLKRAALGRMCTAVRKLGDSLKYLEEVRQHLSRLPSINPNTRTLILAGYPNVGKSSFINSVSHANVDVQPYAFTTKSLFVGHFDFAYTRWQIIDTPGVLDHPLANRNTIELTAITALAHIQAAVLFFVDISEQCGFTIESQVSLFHSIKVLFNNRPLVVILNKVDIVQFSSLFLEKQELLKTMTAGLSDVVVVEASCLTSVGIDEAKTKACEMLLARRVESKIASKKADAISNRLYVTAVVPPVSRPSCIPCSVIEQREKQRQEKQTAMEANENDEAMLGVPLAKDLEEQYGGAGVYSIDLNADWQLRKEWKYDVMPEFYQGKNVLDFIDPDITERLKELELEEAQLLQEDAAMQIDDREWLDVSERLSELHKKIEYKRVENRLKTNLSKQVTPRRSGTLCVSEAETTLKNLGYEIDGLNPRIRKQRRRVSQTGSIHRSAASDSDSEDEAMRGADQNSEDEKEQQKRHGRRASTASTVQSSLHTKLRKMSMLRTQSIGDTPFAQAVKSARESVVSKVKQSLPTVDLRRRVEKMKRKKDRDLKKTRRSGEADRFIGTKMPKHLYSGKRGIGKTDRR